MPLTHRLLHAADSAHEMCFVDRVRPAAADEDVLAVARDPGHFVRHDLAQRDNAIPMATDDAPVYGTTNRISEAAAGDLMDELGRHFAQGRQFAAPIVYAERIQRHAGEHGRQLDGRHGRVRAERDDGPQGQDRHCQPQPPLARPE
jgi:hypothetical protein